LKHNSVGKEPEPESMNPLPSLTGKHEIWGESWLMVEDPTYMPLIQSSVELEKVRKI
jgi:hypothetical protein